MINDPEIVVLAGLLQNPQWISQANLLFDDFHSDHNRVLFFGLFKYRELAVSQGQDRFASASVVTRYLSEIVTGKALKILPQSLDRLQNIPAEAGVVDWHTWIDAVDLIKRQGVDNRTVIGLKDIVDQFLQHGASNNSVREQVMRLHHGMDSSGITSRGVTLGKNTGELLVDYDRRKKSAGADRVMTGYTMLDQQASAKPGRFWIWAGYTNDGKSIMGREFAYASYWQGKNVLFVTAEMTEREVQEAFIVRHSNMISGGPLDWRALDDGMLTPAQELVFRNAMHDMKTNKQFGSMHIWKPPSRSTVADIQSRAMQYNTETPIDMIVLDYLTLFKPSLPGVHKMNRSDQILEMCEEVKGIALDFDNDRGVWIVALHQVSRKGWDEASKRGHYILNDLGESRGVEQNADLVGFIYRDANLKDMHEAKLNIAKNRFGPTLLEGWSVVDEFEHSHVGVLS